MLTFVIVLQVLVALFLIMVVLLQPGNKGGASAALGGAGSDTVFGARGANTFLSKLTFGAAVCFMVTNFALSYMSTASGNSAVLKVLESEQKAHPAASAPENTGAESAAPNSDEDAGKKEEAAPIEGAQTKDHMEAAPAQGKADVAK